VISRRDLTQINDDSPLLTENSVMATEKTIADSPANAPADNRPRPSREKRTIRAMVGIYCRAHHATTGALCNECGELLEYAFCRLDRCPFGEEKTTCARCPVHCYKPEMRSRVKEVMRYAGPRMLVRHPVLALLHTIDAKKKSPQPAE